MNAFIGFAIVLLYSTSCLCDNDHGKNAFSYDADSFNAAVGVKRTFVMFYAPWCGHCKNLAPTWDELAKLYNGNDNTPVIISKVDCTVHTTLCAEHEINGFPTLKLFPIGGANPKRYSGRRDLESLKAFLAQNVNELSEDEAKPEGEEATGDNNNKAAAAVIEDGLAILTDDSFDSHLSSAGLVFVKFYAPWCGHCKRLAPTWKELGSNFANVDGVSIAQIDCDANGVSCSKNQVRGYPTLMLFNNGIKMKKYESERSLSSLQKFVQSEFNNLQGALDKEAVDEALREIHGNDAGEGEGEEEVGEHREEVHELGTVKDLTVENFDGFLSSRLVFVKFFAPWCGHCKRLAPTWEDLAKEFIEHEDVAIAKVDCTLHKPKCDDHQVRGYPTLKIFRDGVKIEDYKQSRTLDSLKDFVKGHMITRDEL